MESSIEYNYRKILEKTKDSIVLGTAQSLIHWDMETMMSLNAVEQRSLQLDCSAKLDTK